MNDESNPAERALDEERAIAREYGGIVALRSVDDGEWYRPETMTAHVIAHDPARVFLQIGPDRWLVRRDEWDRLELQQLEPSDFPSQPGG